MNRRRAESEDMDPVETVPHFLHHKRVKLPGNFGVPITLSSLPINDVRLRSYKKNLLYYDKKQGYNSGNRRSNSFNVTSSSSSNSFNVTRLGSFMCTSRVRIEFPIHLFIQVESSTLETLDSIRTRLELSIRTRLELV